jgi:SAM-dependent methyltransferase
MALSETIAKENDRVSFDRALHRARVAAYPSGEFIGQESFMRATEIRALAVQAGVAPGASVLDLCCGVAGPGRFITRELGCTYLGLDASPSAVEIARGRAGNLDCRFEVARIPPVPSGAFHVVLLLETMLAFPNKEPLLAGVFRALRPGGRFAFTLEEGPPLSEAERALMPRADTVWLTPLAEMLDHLEQAGFCLRRRENRTELHCAVADALTKSFAQHARAIARQIGHEALEDLLVSHRLWSEWLREGRVHKFAVVAERPGERPRAGG